jgi:hypothetical protein
MSKTTPDSYNELFLYHCAVSVRSNFTDTLTTSYTSDINSSLINYFGFSTNNVKSKSSYTSDTWMNMLKTDLNASHPILYTGCDNSHNACHAWVVDGYNTSNQFHMNWGWGGYSNGWYLLTACDVPGYNLNDNQAAILSIQPILDACSGIPGSTYVICATNSNATFSVTVPTWASVTWSKSSNLTQVGGNTGSTYTVYAATGTPSGAATVTANIYNSMGQLFLTRNQNIWIGAPATPTNIIGFAYNGEDFGSNSIYDFIAVNATNQGVNSYNWVVGGGTILSGQGTSTIEVRTATVTGGVNKYFDVSVRVGNSCGVSAYLWRTGYVVSQGGGQYKPIIYPNPANNTLQVQINNNVGSSTSIPENAKIQLFDDMMQLRKTQRIIDNLTSISVSDLRGGVYILKITYGDDVSQEKVVISHE